MRFLLGIDLGTTAVKVAVFNENGVKTGSASKEYNLVTPSALMVELEVEAYWEAFKAALSELTARCGSCAGDIAALSISAQGETLLCVDEDGLPLRRAIVWMDNRAQEESVILEKAFTNETIHKVTGQVSMMAIWPAAKILWIRNHQPEVFARVRRYLLLEDYFICRLTGRYASEGSLLCSTILWDINTKKYWPEMLGFLGISQEQLPEIAEPGQPVGTISLEAARELGLPEGTQVVMGALDQACGAIGAGNVRPGIFSESTGAALAICTVTDRPVFDPAGQMPCFYFGIPDKYMIHSFTSGGMAIRWLRDNFCTGEMAVAESMDTDGYNLMDEEASRIAPGSEGLVVLPHFQGSGPPDSNQSAKAVIYGLSLHHTKAHLIRAFMESIAVTLRRMVEATASMGVDIKEIRSLSGGARSRLWCRMKADVTGIPVKTMRDTSDSACFGAAILAGVAIGIWPSVEEAADMLISHREVFLPDDSCRAGYDKLAAGYGKLTDLLGDAFRTL
jgi:sugar (pentulose or hexulose) kinase